MVRLVFVTTNENMLYPVQGLYAREMELVQQIYKVRISS